PALNLQGNWDLSIRKPGSQCIATRRRRIPVSERFDRVGIQAARFELPPGPRAGRRRQLLPIKLRRILMEFDQRFPESCRRPFVWAARRLRYGDACPLRQMPDGLREGQLLIELNEFDRVAARAAAKALEEPLLSIDVKRRRSFLMEWAEALPRRA